MKTAPPSPERDAMRQSYTQTLRSLYIMAAVVAAAALISSAWVRHYDLDQAHDTDHVLEEDTLATAGEYEDKRIRGQDEKGYSIKRAGLAT